MPRLERGGVFFIGASSRFHHMGREGGRDNAGRKRYICAIKKLVGKQTVPSVITANPIKVRRRESDRKVRGSSREWLMG
jgi:hypothetical protein